jgi:ABC-type multidrug transport system fused ATPase/permease subunit
MNPLGAALEYLLGGPRGGGAQEARLVSWRDLPEPDLKRSHAQSRYVVVDTETTGLDLRHDRVIAIGAVAVAGGRLRLSDCFETVLRQDKPSPNANILIHGIGGQTQLGGVEPRAGMLDFLEFIGKMPLVAFRAEFDQMMLERALRSIVGFPLRRTWIDWLSVAGLFPGPSAGRSTTGSAIWAGRRRAASRHCRRVRDGTTPADRAGRSRPRSDRKCRQAPGDAKGAALARQAVATRAQYKGCAGGAAKRIIRALLERRRSPRLIRMADDTILETRGLTKEFKGFVAVKDVSLAVRRGTIHALIGPNGAGKTTCFNLLTHFLTPTRGQILFNGREITGSRPASMRGWGSSGRSRFRRCFQFTVLENVRIALQQARAFVRFLAFRSTLPNSMIVRGR